MSQTLQFHSTAEELLGKIILELSLTRSGSEEGLIPIYSLLGDLETLCQDRPPWDACVHGLLQSLGDLLDEARGFDDATLDALQAFIAWAQEAISKEKKGEAVPPHPALPGAQTPADAGAGAVVDRADGPAEALEIPETTEADPAAQGDALMVVPLSDDNELLQEFYGEAVDHLEAIEAGVLVLEETPEDPETLNNVFRAFHSLKGVSGFLHLTPIQNMAHEVEHLLDLARGGKLVLNSSHITMILKSKDAIQVLVDQVGLALNEGVLPTEVVPIARLIEALKQAIAAGKASTPAPAESTPEAAAAKQDGEKGFFPRMEVDTPEAAVPANSEKAPAASGSGGPAFSSDYATIRVNTLKLDNLMDTVGELVIVESQLLESSQANVDQGDNSPFFRNLSQLKRITKELQHTSMALRMVPVKPTFQKMGRIVRDLARNMKKEVNFVTSGGETELDRNVIEQIGDPLMHMVRNALDHGLESRETRLRHGKPAAGTLSLNAYHAGGNIVLELTDDGGGINTEKVLRKALERGLVEPDQELSAREIQNLIFQPGFSTADKITEVSGRGVGMDVVRRNIEKLRGSVEVESTEGKGSVFKIKLPLTMAIIDGLIVRAGQDRFILPTTSVRIALKPKPKEIGKVQGRHEVVDFRGNSVPVVKLGELFNLPDAVRNTLDGIIVILESFGRPIGLLVDEMVGKQEVVIKNLGGIMGKIHGVSGGAILGDGGIALILDPPALSKLP